MNGHIKLHRGMLEWGWYKDLPTCKLWLHILLRAGYRACTWQDKEIPRGAFVTSCAALSAESGLTVKQVRTALAKLKKTGEITVETNRHYSMITVSKYDEYQSCEREEAPAKQPPKPAAPRARFTPPTAEEVRAYCTEKGYRLDAEQFVDYYQTRGWKLKTGPMQDWKSAVRTWVRMDKDRQPEKPRFRLVNGVKVYE